MEKMDCVIDVTLRQTNRPKRALTSMCMEVTYKSRLLDLSLFLALAGKISLFIELNIEAMRITKIG